MRSFASIILFLAVMGISAQQLTVPESLRLVGDDLDRAAMSRQTAAVLMLAGTAFSIIGFTSTGEDAKEKGLYFVASTMCVTTVILFNASAHEQRAAQRLRHLCPP